MQHPAFIRIEPDDPRHRQLIKAALKARDTSALKALRGNNGKPIDFVMNWFSYFLMRGDSPKPDTVSIFSPKTRRDMNTFQKSQPDPVPDSVYEFLK